MNVVNNASAVALCAVLGLGLSVSPGAAREKTVEGHSVTVKTIKTAHGTKTVTTTTNTSHGQTTKSRDVRKSTTHAHGR
jgi:hypothetical protein